MTLEDLAACEAEVIQPIKYDFKVGQAGDKGVSLWEVSYTDSSPLLSDSAFHASPLLSSGSW